MLRVPCNDASKLNYLKLMQEKYDRPTDTDDMRVEEPEVSNDIYMLAFVACINPQQTEKEDGCVHNP